MVKEGQLLGPVGGIVGRVQIDRDAPGSALQTTAMSFDYAVGQRFAQTKQLFAIPAIFKARQGRLRSQVFALNWIATHQQFVDRVGTQSGGIVGIRIPARNRHDPLRDQFSQLMPDLFRLPLVFQGLGQHGSQSQSSISGAKQDRSPVGTALSLIKLCDDRTLKNSWEENALCRVMLAQTKASFLVKDCVNNSFLPWRGFSCF
jgi:hypothetical protein